MIVKQINNNGHKMNTRIDRLNAKVTARNRVNAELLKHIPAMLAALQPFIGQKVQNVTGQLNKKAQAALPPAIYEAGPSALMSWYEPTRYSIRVCFEASESIPNANGCVYAENSFTLADLGEHDGNLVKVSAAPLAEHYRTDYTVAEVQGLRGELEKAKTAMQEIESKLRDFGQYDN